MSRYGDYIYVQWSFYENSGGWFGECFHDLVEATDWIRDRKIKWYKISNHRGYYRHHNDR